MNKKELIPQLTSLVEGYTEGLRSANNKLFHSGQRLTAEKQEWEQKYHSAMAANKRLDEQNEGLRVEKQALLDVVADWKSENQSLAALNETLSTESQNWQGQCAELRGQYSLVLKELNMSKQMAEHCKAESLKESLKRTEVEEQLETAEETTKHWFRRAENIAKELAETKERWLQQVEYADKYAAELVIREKELAEKETALSKAFAAAEERYEDSKKRSDGILATMGENLQRKQKQIEALTTWKEGTEKVLYYIEARAKEKQEKIDSLIGNNEILARTAYNFQAQLEALKQINSFQEHRIEVLSRKARKKAKEQND